MPGPTLFRASELPYLFFLATGRLPYVEERLHQQYGEIVRIAPNDLSFDSSRAWKDIYGHRSEAKAIPFLKHPKAYAQTANKTASIVQSPPPRLRQGTLVLSQQVISNDDDHRRMRKLVSHAFSDKALSEQGDILLQHVDALLAHFRAAATAGQPLDLVQYVGSHLPPCFTMHL